jgi:OmcA/MtrC family decaheme c-type cytochrome
MQALQTVIRREIRALTLLAAACLGCVVLLSGCGGSGTGSSAPGPTGGTDIGAAAEIDAVITSVTISSPPVVGFSLSDENGDPLVGLQPGDISLNLAKLVPGTDGASSWWQSYINRIEVIGSPPVGPGTEDKLQATTENGSAGTLIDNNNGSYSYTFSFDINSVTVPVKVEYVPTLTHRVSFEIRGYVPVNNPVYDWRPSDNSTSHLFSREIAKTETCNNCHENLALHGGARFEMQECVTCHNPGSADANSGNTVDMVVMAHKIHMGANLPSVQAGGSYCIYGFGDIPQCYDDVVYPQDIRNCRSCHDENDPQTPDAARWFTQPRAAACGSCHDDVNFATGENHGDEQIIVNDDIECATCHGASPLDPNGVQQTHRNLAVERASEYRFDILGVAFTPPSGAASSPTVRIAISNPQLGDPDEQTARYDLENDPELAASSLNLRLAWNTIDYANWGAGTSNGAPQSAAVYAGGILQASPNGDLTYNLAVGSVPDGTTGTGVIIFEGGVQIAGAVPPATAPVTAAYYYFGITDDPPIDRRTRADIERCNDCHGLTTYHGGNRNNSLQDCQVCHNANAARGGSPSRGPMDMKHFLHRKHAVDTDVHYPQRTSNCLACHTDDGFYPVASDSGVLATSVNRGDSGATTPPPVEEDPSNNNRYSPNAAACGVCHDDDMNNLGVHDRDHMENYGSSFDACQDQSGALSERVNFCGTGGTPGALVTENCTGCHGQGGSIDVAVRHRLDL